MLLPELLSCLVLLSVRCGAAVRASRAVSVVGQTLELLDRFNQLAPGRDRDDQEDLAWPGVWSKEQSVYLFVRHTGKIKVLNIYIELKMSEKLIQPKNVQKKNNLPIGNNLE